MRIKEVIINNFKNYIGEHIINLDKKITILYGENGYGKSSFFDAIEWALTGTINRFEKDPNFSVQDLINDNIYNDPNHECSVTVRIDNIYVKRYIKNKNVYVKLRGSYVQNNETIELNATGKDNVEKILKEIFFNKEKSLVNNMMKHSFILSQDQVTDFIVRDDPKERYKSMADIMGLRKVINYTENTKLFLSQLRSIESSLNDDLEKQVNVIKLVNDKHDNLNNIKDDFKRLIETEKDINDNNLQKNIELSIQKTNDKLYDLESRKKNYKNLIDKGINTYSQLEENINNLKKTIEKYYEHNIRVKSNISNLETSVSKLLDKENNLNEYKRLLKKRRVKCGKISELNNSLRENSLYRENIDVKSINQAIDKKQKEIDVYNFASLNRNDYRKAIKFFEGYSESKKNLFNSHNKLHSKLDRKQKRFNNLSAQLANMSDSNSLSNLLENIKGIFNYSKSVNEKKTCPVCSSNVHSLQDNILSNIDNYKDELSLKSLKVQRLSEIISGLRNRIAVINNELRNIKEKIKRLDEDENYYTQSLNNIRNQDNYVEEVMKFGEDYINEKLANTRESVNSFINIKNKIIEIKKLEEDVEYIEKQINEKDQKNADSVDNTIKRTNRLVEKRKKYVLKCQSKIEEIQNKYNFYKELSLKLDYEENPEHFENKVSKNELDKVELQKSLNKLKNIEQRVYQYNNNKELFAQYNKANEKIEQINKEKTKNNIIITKLETHLSDINTTFGEEAMEFLNKPQSIIQKYYRYMNPMTSSKELKFLSNNEELQIKIHDMNNNSELNAKTTLSSGQLNILAISIFLASNNSLDSNINFIGIDDPIQNMDDVNRFSICDMLGNIKKQLIFSTHDIEFLKLFVKKNEHEIEDIQVYNFSKPVLTQGSINKML
jgi:DNA repair protein SbcC/Rad50